MKFKKELCFRTIKILDIAYTSIIAVFFGILVAFLSDELFKKYDRQKYEELIKQDPTQRYKLYLKLMLVALYTGVVAYLIRNTIELIPSPFDGICKFEHKRLSELRSIPITIFILFFVYQADLYSHARDEFKKLF